MSESLHVPVVLTIATTMVMQMIGLWRTTLMGTPILAQPIGD
jgi:hypothetical protein